MVVVADVNRTLFDSKQTFYVPEVRFYAIIHDASAVVVNLILTAVLIIVIKELQIF